MPQPISSYSHFPGYRQPPPPEVIIPTSDSITRESIAIRLQSLLSTNLPGWISRHIVHISTSLTERIVSLGKNGDLAPHGIGSVDDIFMVVGHDRGYHYLALAVTAPIALKVLMKGPSYSLDGMDPLRDQQSMEILRRGFGDVAFKEWSRASEMLGRGGSR
ncbi:hypothetical protein IQ06DRAFT_212341 [Phaeosphaeriaceae sp. SRC1lsM3a]|nr:hypothetical protein IQ06DRAFT_212341 [Stagonospora sp. SRC1lsM3a]